MSAVDLSDDYKRSTLDLLISLRGGLPETCDFCGLPYVEGRYPVPEEAGEWACNECVKRWDVAEREEREEAAR